ncbi:hypothetical protein DFH08DRAFT_1008201 [Mycena albidolilacea]|uniref:Uncharacterized protein n=1 Tax=Mycena albidolilacea TaxID=1033008 RepID=A0AAD7A033_9AGAR|nr:hypothetical protein DFH08DRAFT_1008201 [Mycena albidolilacea]
MSWTPCERRVLLPDYLQRTRHRTNRVTPATQPHRKVDLAIVEADRQGKECAQLSSANDDEQHFEGYTNTYIVLPGLVYGAPRGILAQANVQNPMNFAITACIKASFERKAAGIVGKGKNIISHVDVTEVADWVETLYNSIARNHAEYGRDGYYFVAHGDIEFERSLRSPRDGQAFLRSFFGDNGRCDPQRSHALGWKPLKTTEDLLAAVREEVEQWKM